MTTMQALISSLAPIAGGDFPAASTKKDAVRKGYFRSALSGVAWPPVAPRATSAARWPEPSPVTGISRARY
eukprot:39663-Pyramimonas_sp.AAC.1